MADERLVLRWRHSVHLKALVLEPCAAPGAATRTARSSGISWPIRSRAAAGAATAGVNAGRHSGGRSRGRCRPRLNATPRHAVTILKNLHGFLVDQDHLMGNPWSAVGVPRTNGPKVNAGRSFSVAQWGLIEGQLKMLPQTWANQPSRSRSRTSGMRRWPGLSARSYFSARRNARKAHSFAPSPALRCGCAAFDAIGMVLLLNSSASTSG